MGHHHVGLTDDLAHYHPSGDPSPSEVEIRVTRDQFRAGPLLKVAKLLDQPNSCRTQSGATTQLNLDFGQGELLNTPPRRWQRMLSSLGR